jgi:periplasmic protein TonB
VSIVEEVFRHDGSGKSKHVWFAVVVAVLLHIFIGLLAVLNQPEIHAPHIEPLVQSVDTHVIPQAQLPASVKSPDLKHLAKPASRSVRRVPPPPAKAAVIIATEQSVPAPVEVGNAENFVGGTTSSEGKNSVAVDVSAVDPNAKPTSNPQEVNRAARVSLRTNNWNCPWPSEADAEQINEQFVVLRVVVDKSGSVISARVINEPGFGFGDAAKTCAMRTHFSPARDAQGDPVQAESPPIRVRFVR